MTYWVRYIADSPYIMSAICIILSPACISSAAPFAYITNQGSHDISVIDVASDKVVSTIAVGKSPAGVVAVSAVGKVFITNPESRNVSVIDMRTNGVIDTIPKADAPHEARLQAPLGIDASRDGKYVFVADWQAHQLLTFDASTHGLAWKLTLGKAPSGIAAHPDNQRVFVAERDEDQVAVIDIQTHEVIQRIKTQSHPFALMIDRKGEKLYTLNVWSNSVTISDATAAGKGRLLSTVPVGKAPYGAAESSDGSRVYVSNQHGETVSVIDTTTLKVTQTLKGFEYPEGVYTHGHKLYAVNWMSDSVSVINTDTGAVLTEIAVGKNPRGFGAFIGAPQSVAN
jgi:YVTN family beta-propeller protein